MSSPTNETDVSRIITAYAIPIVSTGLTTQHGGPTESLIRARQQLMGETYAIHLGVQQQNPGYQIPAIKFDFTLQNDLTNYNRLKRAIVNHPTRRP